MATKIVLGVGAALLAIAIASYASVSSGMESHQTLNPDGIKAIEIVGSNTGLRLVGESEGTSRISVNTSDAMGCSLTANTSKANGVLTIELERSGGWPFGWCDPEASIVLPNRIDVAVKLDKLAGDFSGSFNTFSVKAEKSVIYFVGDVSSFDLSGDMAAVYLKFAEGVSKENIHLNVDKLVSDMNFTGGWKSATSILREIF
ncbi:hypothetical protein [Pseudovibrio sp. Tun.PSC04-5.I4]|uniref:hypothetical protein n=1 Tax=Pseudovibrio sp. Tun.PSC04-5.I4 TaxID=1798213 RepID=UPI000883D824|nr:hypothetical protein [Pseudovibrio sp. Tun.PSC04-5.I4]SDR47392.1 hypothetical protein SAMN04515695_5782 [Pseudovibrio sp. Tun.PSC04-5.I4]